jgi:hypothetical protein
MTGAVCFENRCSRLAATATTRAALREVLTGRACSSARMALAWHPVFDLAHRVDFR